jgi:hypothetical protein
VDLLLDGFAAEVYSPSSEVAGLSVAALAALDVLLAERQRVMLMVGLLTWATS